MVALADLLDTAPAAARPAQRMPVAVATADQMFLHLANAKRRALIRAVGFDEVAECDLRAQYGPSWGAVQADLRVLVQAGILVASGVGPRVRYRLDLSLFPAGMLERVLGRTATVLPLAGRHAIAA